MFLVITWGGTSEINSAKEKSFHISGHLRGSKSTQVRKFLKTPSLIPTFEGRFVNPEAITFLSSYISGHLEGQNLTLLGYEIVRWCLWSSPSGCPNHCLNYIKDRLKTPEQIWCNFAIFVSNLTQLHDSIKFSKSAKAPTLDLQIQCRCFCFWYGVQENGHGIFLASIAKWRHISQKLGNIPNPLLVTCEKMDIANNEKRGFAHILVRNLFWLFN